MGCATGIQRAGSKQFLIILYNSLYYIYTRAYCIAWCGAIVYPFTSGVQFWSQEYDPVTSWKSKKELSVGVLRVRLVSKYQLMTVQNMTVCVSKQCKKVQVEAAQWCQDTKIRQCG